jgi:hypothetical protein
MDKNQFETDLENIVESFQKGLVNQADTKTALNKLLLSKAAEPESGEVRLKLRQLIALLGNSPVCRNTFANEFEKIIHALRHQEIIW